MVQRIHVRIPGVVSARRQNSPVFKGAVTDKLVVDVLTLPDLPLTEETNPRDRNRDLAVYRKVERSLLNGNGTPNSFLEKNKGILLIADDLVPVKGTTDEFDVYFSAPEHGIADGGHTAEIIWENQETLRKMVDEGDDVRQFVAIDVMRGYPETLIPDIIEGRNSSMQVAEFSMLDFTGAFERFKATFKKAEFNDLIAYRQNADGHYDIRDILMFAEALDVTRYPNDGDDYPVRSYSSKQSVLHSFAGDTSRYDYLLPVLIKAIQLFEWIGYEGRDLLLAQPKRPRNTDVFIEERARGSFEFPFIGEEGDYRVHRGVAMPVLGAFRNFLAVKNGKAVWTEEPIDIWDSFGGKLMLESALSLRSRDINAVAKDRTHWANLHTKLALWHARA